MKYNIYFTNWKFLYEFYYWIISEYITTISCFSDMIGYSDSTDKWKFIWEVVRNKVNSKWDEKALVKEERKEIIDVYNKSP